MIAAYRALGLGDFLTGIPALRALRRAFPGERLVLCAPAALAPLAALSGAVDAVCDTAPLAVPALSDRPRVAVNLHGRGPQSHRALLACEPQRLVAFACAQAGVDGPAWRADEHERARWCRLLTESAVPAPARSTSCSDGEQKVNRADPEDLDLPPPPWPAPAAAHGATVIHPGAASRARRWPAERFAAVAGAEQEAGQTVLVTGSPDERALAERVARLAGLPSAAVLAGRTDLRALAATVAAAGCVVCGDTGVAHLATAFGTPSVVLFGPTPPALWGPPPARPQHRPLWAGRTGDPHATEPDPGLLEITVEAVLDALTAAGSARRAPPASPR